MPKLADKTVRVGNLVAEPSQIRFGGITCAYLPDGAPVVLPLIVVNGAMDGPVLMLSGAMHGLELIGTEVIRQVTREVVKPADLRGAIIAAPVLNPFAFHARSMTTPQDQLNINYVFPGGPDQSLSRRLADLILKELISRADYELDLHSNMTPSIPFTILHYAADEAVGAESRRMAEAVGFTLVDETEKLPGQNPSWMMDWILAAGKPALVVELIDSRRINPVAARAGVRAVLNVMKLLGLLEGKIEPQVELPVLNGLCSRTEVTATRGGLVHLRKEAGDPVAKGEVLAMLYDAYGDLAEEVRSPVDGFVLAYPLRETQAAGTGTDVVFLVYPRDSR
ncbi:MAG: hypothetical protein EHM35_11105 [Planctomycetaceae bacterium]|nr:MAG: hypothetical protein EHM35_11105 [Planctomycetaceae bacterium]